MQTVPAREQARKDIQRKLALQRGQLALRKIETAAPWPAPIKAAEPACAKRGAALASSRLK